MKYNRAKIVERYHSEERLKFLFFWGHQPSKDGSVSASCFSQWWLSDFVVDDISYKSAEHWMMAGKARLFEDHQTLEKILEADSPALAKKLGRQVQNFDGAVWNREGYNIVVEGNTHKFKQNESFKEFLLNTSDRILVEASPVDRIWGIGLAKDHADVENPERWKGENLLGFALMEVRDILGEDV